MGCDIHATLEYDWMAKRKSRDSEQKPWWRSFAKDIEIDRNYTLFSVLAGVRGAEEPIALPRGMPQNASWEHKDMAEDWGGDGHSHSHVYLTELKEWMDDNLSAIEYGDWTEDDWFRTMELLGSKYGNENVRLCFFFDN